MSRQIAQIIHKLETLPPYATIELACGCLWIKYGPAKYVKFEDYIAAAAVTTVANRS